MKLEEKRVATKLRKRGYSINEINKKLGISKGTLSLWLRGVTLSKNAQKRINLRLTNGQRKAAIARHLKRVASQGKQKTISEGIVTDVLLTKNTKKVICSLIYWCEGNKSEKDLVFFTNSDPGLISIFLSLMRTSFDLDEAKFRVCMHLHAYHNEQRQLQFWSKVTKISVAQFLKTYRKEHTSKRIRDGYQGCVQVRYYDVKVARELLITANVFIEAHGSVG